MGIAGKLFVIISVAIVTYYAVDWMDTSNDRRIRLGATAGVPLIVYLLFLKN
ncbi:MAG: hypothetical protein J6X12_10370 [Paludibacteraceae bacterium]|jgi:hypothetical protein|nr:hypothetical protein [Paludibacteraceae bacterium]